MLRLLFVFGVLQCCLSQQYQDRVAPGVNPNQYQPGPPQQYQPPPPPPPQQQYQQPPPQQQQQQYQQQQYQQQVPVQQMPVQQQQQVPVQQMPPSQHGGHGDPQILNPHMSDERKHIEEHMDVPMDTSKMSEQELQFHYFKMHDADNNNKLDGCELIKSLIHWHAEQGHKQEDTPNQNQPPAGDKIFQDLELVNLIDPILKMDDHNGDGYIDYPEFVRAQQKSQQKQG